VLERFYALVAQAAGAEPNSMHIPSDFIFDADARRRELDEAADGPWDRIIEAYESATDEALNRFRSKRATQGGASESAP